MDQFGSLGKKENFPAVFRGNNKQASEASTIKGQNVVIM